MRLLTATEAARASGLSASHIKHACQSGELRAEKLGKTWVFTPDDFNTWYEQRRRVGNPEWIKNSPAR